MTESSNTKLQQSITSKVSGLFRHFQIHGDNSDIQNDIENTQYLQDNPSQRFLRQHAPEPKSGEIGAIADKDPRRRVFMQKAGYFRRLCNCFFRDGECYKYPVANMMTVL